MAVISLFGKKDPAEQAYRKGLRHLKAGEMAEASQSFSEAMQAGHAAAAYNLSVLWGMGAVSPYDFDVAADCWYKAAAAGNETARQSLWLLEAADRAGFGNDNLIALLGKQPKSPTLNGTLMICAARFYDAVCRQYGATADVIAYELDGASSSEMPFVHAFIARTGIDRSFYAGGLDRLTEGSAADQVTDGLNAFSVALRQSGCSMEMSIMARCSIVGYMIRKSAYGGASEPLLGTDRFFDARQPAAHPAENHPILQRLCDLLQDETCERYFVMALHSGKVQAPLTIATKVQEAISVAQEISELIGIAPIRIYEAIKREQGAGA
ncbi:hypothetical protein ACFORG_22050 [Lutimaribacter marinistellae]|uniref:Sel1 repeat family protein n=1 Tax=Lutimaribacter marinistellae TaxID=1820329 RepID=A0ABV7TQS2_9RHOB